MPDQVNIDEGLRRLEEFHADPTPRTFNAWVEWRHAYSEDMLHELRDRRAAAQAAPAISVEEFAREVLRRIEARRAIWQRGTEELTGEPRKRCVGAGRKAGRNNGEQQCQNEEFQSSRKT